MITIISLIMVLIALVWVRPRPTLRVVSATTQLSSQKLIDDFADGAEEEEPERSVTESTPGTVSVRLVVAGEQPTKPQVDKRDTSRIIRLAAAHVVKRIGLPKRTEANVMVARRLVVEYLETIKDLRTTHYLRIVPLAVELAFIPTRYDIAARDLAACAQAQENREAFDIDRAAVRPGWGPFGLFGRKRYSVRPPMA